MSNRIYLVHAVTGQHVLVRAASPAQALRHVARNHYTVTVAKQDDIVEAAE